jgi:hypothetical protein
MMMSNFLPHKRIRTDEGDAYSLDKSKYEGSFIVVQPKDDDVKLPSEHRET